jgi:two-component system nitrate/nitrite response regulator NarL
LLARTNSENSEQAGNVRAGGFARRFGEEGARAKRALLVDDHDLFREVLAVIFEQVTDLRDNVQAGSAAEARRILSGPNGNDFALAVVDLDLPDGGGMELIGELRRAGIQVLALTASRDSKRLAWASRSGPDEVLTTSASCNEILDIVRRLVGA